MTLEPQGPLDIRPEALADEALKVQQKLGAGLNTLREVDDVEYGATAKSSSIAIAASKRRPPRCRC
jgi:polyhydroxyalkanoate synthase